MDSKRKKLSEQFVASSRHHISDIFKGIGIFVNGYTGKPYIKTIRKAAKNFLLQILQPMFFVE